MIFEFSLNLKRILKTIESSTKPEEIQQVQNNADFHKRSKSTCLIAALQCDVVNCSPDSDNGPRKDSMTILLQTEKLLPPSFMSGTERHAQLLQELNCCPGSLDFGIVQHLSGIANLNEIVNNRPCLRNNHISLHRIHNGVLAQLNKETCNFARTKLFLLDQCL